MGGDALMKLAVNNVKKGSETRGTYDSIEIRLIVHEDDLEETLGAIWGVRPTVHIVTTRVSLNVP